MLIALARSSARSALRTRAVLSPLYAGLSRSLATSKENQEFLSKNAASEGVIVTESGLQYKVIATGPPDGTSPTRDDPCEVHYEGRLLDGTVFDSSLKRGRPATFMPKQVIGGWTEALQIMKPGDKWELTIPPSIGYGSYGSGPIPGNAILQFELELLKVKTGGGGGNPLGFLADPVTFAILMVMGTGAYCITTYGFGGGGTSDKKMLMPSEAQKPDDPAVFFDMEIGGQPAGRIELTQTSDSNNMLTK